MNTEQNQELLQNTPNRSFQDLSIIYRWIVKQMRRDSEYRNTTHLQRIRLVRRADVKLAVDNTRRLFPPSVKSMNDVIREMLQRRNAWRGCRHDDW